MVFSVGGACEVSSGDGAGAGPGEHPPLTFVLQITAVMVMRMMATEWNSRPGRVLVLDSKCICFMGVRWALGPRLIGMISETRPVKHCPTYLKLSSVATLWTIVFTIGNHVLSNVRDIFAQQGKLAVCLCVMKHGQRVAGLDPTSWPGLLVTD